MKKVFYLYALFLMIAFQFINQSVVESAHYYVYTINSKNGSTINYYIDSDHTGVYYEDSTDRKIKFSSDRNKKIIDGRLFRVRCIEVIDWNEANQYHQKQEIKKKDYYFYRRIKNATYSVFDDFGVGAIINAFKYRRVDNIAGDGIRCLEIIVDKNNQKYFRDHLVKEYSYYDDAYCDRSFYDIYKKAREIYGVPNNYKQTENYIEEIKSRDHTKRFSRDDVQLIYCGKERVRSTYNLAVIGYNNIYFVVCSVRGSSRENFECVIKNVYISTVHEAQNRTQYINFKVCRRKNTFILVEEGLDFRMSNGFGGFFKFNDDIRNTREHGAYFNVYKEAIKYI